jgi:hypothetical protein
VIARHRNVDSKVSPNVILVVARVRKCDKKCHQIIIIEGEEENGRFLVGMFRNQFLEAGDDAKVSPKIVSPNKEAVFFIVIFFGNGIRIKCH